MKRFYVALLVGLCAAVLDHKFGGGIIFAVIMFGISSRVTGGMQHDMDYLAGFDDLDHEGVPESEDGPWAEGWEDRCGSAYLKEAFRKGRRLARWMREVTWYRLQEGWSWYKKEVFKGEFVTPPHYDSPRRVEEIRRLPCGTATIWDFQKEFDFQTDFFNFVEIVSPAFIKADLITKFNACLPEGLEDKYRISVLEHHVETHKFALDRCKQAFDAIAQKMNSAGAALHW